MIGRIRSFFSQSRSLDRILEYKSYRGRRLSMESLEDRRMLAIVWTNRGNAGTDADMFNATYGAMAQVARQNIDRAIENWNEVILDYNFDGDNNPATNNVFTLTVMAADLGGSLRGQGAPTNVDGNGLPTSGNLTMDDAGGSGGWFIDPTPFADDEFLFPVTQFEANSTQAGNDFFRTAVHEIGHTVGILTGFGVALNNFLTPAGTDQVSGADNLNIFQNVAGQFGVSVTITDNGGGHVYEGPVDPAFPGAPINPNDLMNPGRTVGPPATRQMITDLNAMILADAYGYKVQLPSATAFTFIAQDQLEDNNTLQTASVLGSLPKVTINDVSIFDIGDEDFYRYTAPLNGKLDVRAFFNHAVGNDIDIQVLGANGADITPVGQGDSTTDNEQIIVPVVAGQTYFIRVFGADGSIQNYDLEVENFAAPAPAFVDLLASSDTGMMNNDDITSDTTPTFLIQADLAEFLNTGITLLNQPVIDPDNNGIATDANDDGAGVYLSLINIATGALVEGFANQVGATGILWSFTVPAISALAAGDWFVSSAVQIVDPQDTNPAAGTQRATGRAQLSDPLIITIIPEGTVVNTSLDLVTSSDTGMLNTDNVTNKMSPAFVGVAPVGFKVRLYANGSLVGQTVAGSDTSDVGVGGVGGLGGANNDGFGIWEITTEPLADDAYDITLEIEDAAGNVTIIDPSLNDGTNIDIWVDTIGPNTPFLDILATSDSGRSNIDDVTFDSLPTVVMRGNATPGGGATNPFPNDVKFRLYLRPDGAIPTSEILVYDSFTALGGFTTLSSITQTISLALNNPAGPVIPDGLHNFKLEVEDRAGNISHDFLLPFEVDTVAPPVSFGEPGIATDGLKGSSDTGVLSDPPTLNDRITKDSTPTLWGYAEANSIVRVYADINENRTIDAGDKLLGLTVALPYDGNLAFADGYWELTTSIDLNDPAFFAAKDGLRSLLVSAEDVAGNVNLPDDGVDDDLQLLDIFVDTQGPRISNVFVTDDPTYDLFDPKPSTDGPTPLVNRITVKFTDLPTRLQEFLYPAVNEGLATTIGNYQLVGDHVGNILITEVLFNDLTAPGGGGGVGGGGGAVAAAAIGSGGVIVDGGDRDDHGSSTAGADAILGTADDINLDGWQFIEQMVSYAAANSQNGGTGILAIGTSSTALSAITSVATVLGIPLAVATTGGAIDLSSVNFNDYAILYVPSDANNTTGGVSNTDLNTLTARKLDVQNYVNSGGSLVALTERGFATPYSWLELPGTFTVGNPSTDIQYQTQALIDAGLVITNAELINGTPLHNTFTGPVGFNGLQPFVYNVGANGINEDGGGDDQVITLGLGQGQFLGGMVMTEVTLVFNQFLPDDRYTLTVRDTISDDAGNALDGESQAASPFDSTEFGNVVFPSGDGDPGGDFIARFTIDTRPELGTYVAQNISIDINGNFVWDPANGQIGNDATNVDLSFTLPVAAPGGGIGPGGYNVHDLLFAGRFSLNDVGGSDGFDTLAAFGNSAELGVFRWLVDRNHDGVVSPALGDILTTQPLLPNFNVPGAIPVAGNFVGGGLSDDEIGLYNQGKWAFDTNKNFIIEAGEVFTNGMLGHPIVGDFDGEGLDDLAVFNNNQLFFNFANDGLTDAADQVVVWGYPGVLDRPVAADMDRDGIDDIGLFVPRDSSATPPRQSEWYFLISDDHAGTKRVTGSAVTLNHPFTTVPFGKDLYAEFGDDLALPIVGNFDPPVAVRSVNPQGGMDGDFDGDNDVDGRDFLAWQRSYGSTVNLAADGDHNNVVDSGDLAMWSGAYTNSSSAAMTTDYDGDADVDGHDFLMLQRSGASSAAIISWQAEFGNSGSASLLASFSAVENDPPTASLSSVSEATPAGQSIVSSPALFWLSLPEQTSSYSEVEYFDSFVELPFEQARAENWSTFGAALTISHTEDYQFSVDENESDADFELALDEAFSEMGI